MQTKKLTKKTKTVAPVVKVSDVQRTDSNVTYLKSAGIPHYDFVQVNEFQPNVDGWSEIGEIVQYQHIDERTVLLTNHDDMQIQLSFMSPTSMRLRFRPQALPDYDLNNDSYAVVDKDIAPLTLNLNEVDKGGKTLHINTGEMDVFVGLNPYGLAIYRGGELITEDCLGKNLVYSNEAVAYLRKSPDAENYYGFGEKAGDQLNKKNLTMTCFNYDNFCYQGDNVIPADNDAGPLNPSEPLYNSIPFMMATGNNSHGLYSYGIFLDNVGQSYFNMGANDYSDMSGKYYFGALFNDFDVYFMVGESNPSNNFNPMRSVLNQYTSLTGRSALPPKYAFGYQQGGYGYYNREILMKVAQDYRDNNIPIDGLHIDVDFQDNYRTFTSSPEKFPNPKQMFDELHGMGFKCSTNITGIISANPLDEKGNRDTPYPARDSFVNILDDQDNTIVVKEGAEVPFIYNTRDQQGESPYLFIANESYGENKTALYPGGLNPNKYPTPMFPNGQDALGTYGFYCDMASTTVQKWWGEQYKYLLDCGLDMVWQDMTDPAVVPNFDNGTPDKTLPLNLMMYDRVSDKYQPHAKIHNAFAINLIRASFEGIEKLKASDDMQGSYNYNKRNFIIARGAYAGVHRYAGVWTGDSASSWDFLKINIPEVVNFGLSGQAISGCDIGGFANGSGSVGNGITNYELFTRWMTMGAFMPWFRNHYDAYNKEFQEPYRYGEPVPTHCRKYINIRYRLMQLFYDAMYQNTLNGLPIARALFLNEPQDAQVFNHLDDQFFVGDNLLVAPVVEEGAVYRDVYLPASDQWYVYSDNTAVLSGPTSGGTTQNWYAPLDTVPLYVREGAILPHRELEQYVGELAVNPITFNIYPGKDSSYELYQDDQVSTANIKQKAYRTSTISHQGIENGQQISIKRSYDKFTPAEDFFYVSLLGTNPPSSVTRANDVLANAGSAEALADMQGNGYYYNASIKTTFVKVMDDIANINLTVLF
jgi:alpha-glucosidase